MRVLVVNPNTSTEMTDDIDRAANTYAAASTHIVTTSPAWGPRSIEGHFEDALAATATVETIAANRDDYDGFVIACYGDPGLAAAREITTAPVVGIAEASMLTACTVAHQFSIVTVLQRIVPMLRDLVRTNGLETRCASVRATPLSVLDIDNAPDQALDEIAEQGKRAIDQDDAEAICLGCAGMGPLDKKLQQRLNVPVIDGVATAVKMIELTSAYGITTSKVAAYKHPEPKELPGCTDAVRAVSRQATTPSQQP